MVFQCLYFLTKFLITFARFSLIYTPLIERFSQLSAISIDLLPGAQHSYRIRFPFSIYRHFTGMALEQSIPYNSPYQYSWQWFIFVLGLMAQKQSSTWTTSFSDNPNFFARFSVDIWKEGLRRTYLGIWMANYCLFRPLSSKKSRNTFGNFYSDSSLTSQYQSILLMVRCNSSKPKERIYQSACIKDYNIKESNHSFQI